MAQKVTMILNLSPMRSYSLPPMPNPTGQMSYGLCVMNAAGVEVKTSIDALTHTSQGTFGEGMTTMWTGDWNREPFYPIGINGLGDAYCEGGEYLAPNIINHSYQNVDIELVTKPANGNTITACAMVCVQYPGGWSDALTSAGFSASQAWQIQETGHSEPSKYTFQTYCKELSLDESSSLV